MLTRFVFASKIKASGRARQVAKTIQASVPQRRNELSGFYDTYENLIETICDAAQYGVTEGLEQNYSQYRNELISTYTPLKPFLLSYLGDATEDVEFGMKVVGRPMDAFEVLVAADNLRAFVKLDDGNMISRLTRTREALTAYSEHLRLLAERAA